MKRLLLSILIGLLVSSPLFSQTTVNLTVQDTGGLLWTGAWNVVLNPPITGNQRPTYTILSGGGSTSPQNGTLSASGTAAIVLPANANIAPIGTLWVFTVCPGVGACFTQLVTVSTSSPQTLSITPPPAVVPASSGGGGPTSVLSLPATCTVNAQFQLPDGTIATCGPVANKYVTSYNGRPTIDPRVFGAKEDARFWVSPITSTITLAGNSNALTVSNANFCNAGSVPCAAGQTTDVGKVVNVTNGSDQGIGGATASVSLLPASTTISSVTSSTQVTLSANSTGSPVCGAACSVAVFTDDDTAATSVDAALAALPNCGIVHLVGFMAVKSGHFNTANITCAKAAMPADALGGAWIAGESVATSGIYIENEFNPATCTGNNGSFSNVCFGAAVGGGSNFEMYGLFNSRASSSDSVHIFAPVVNNTVANAFTNVAFLDFMGGDDGGGIGTNVGFTFGSGTLTDVQVIGFGATGCAYGGQGGPGYTIMHGGGCGNTKDSNLLVNGPLVTNGATFGQTGSGQATVFENNAAGLWYSHGDAIFGNPTSGPANILVNVNLGTAYIDGLTADNSGFAGGSYAVSAGGAGAIIHLKDSVVKGSTTGGSVNVGNGAIFFDEGGNTYNSVTTTGATAKIIGSGAGTVSNTTSVTATNPSAATILQEIPLLAGFFSLPNQSYLFHANGVFTTAAVQTPTLTFVLQLCTGAGGTGTCVAQATWVTNASTASSSNNNWAIDAPVTVVSQGATGTLLVGGYVSADLGATTVIPDTIQGNANAGASAATNLTVALFMSLTVQMSSANAGNSVKSLQTYIK